MNISIYVSEAAGAKALGAEAAGPPGNWEKGKRALDAYLVSLGVPSRAGYVADGSGLSPHNAIAVIPGSERPDETIIINAHADAWFDGAGDNGDGLAVLVALA